MPGDEIIRSARKSISAEIHSDGRLILRVPHLATQRQIDAFLQARSGWIARHRASPPPKDPREGLSEKKIGELRARACRELPVLAEKWAPVVGAYPDRIRITSAKGRFGSCSGRANICFSLYLMLWPVEAVEYVVVHELCHIRQKNHGPAFWADVAKAMPDWKRREQLLRKTPET